MLLHTYRLLCTRRAIIGFTSRTGYYSNNHSTWGESLNLTEWWWRWSGLGWSSVSIFTSNQILLTRHKWKSAYKVKQWIDTGGVHRQFFSVAFLVHNNHHLRHSPFLRVHPIDFNQHSKSQYFCLVCWPQSVPWLHTAYHLMDKDFHLLQTIAIIIFVTIKQLHVSQSKMSVQG